MNTFPFHSVSRVSLYEMKRIILDMAREQYPAHSRLFEDFLDCLHYNALEECRSVAQSVADELDQIKSKLSDSSAVLEDMSGGYPNTGLEQVAKDIDVAVSNIGEQQTILEKEGDQGNC